MRITRLRLTAYGNFSGYDLQLSNTPAVHILCGANEVGKSTARRALGSALFGYPHNMEDDWLHDAKNMSVGVDLLSASGSTLEFNRRRRGGRVALATVAGEPLAEAAVAAFLGGITRELFEKVYGLSHEALRKHASALVQEGGVLGFSLAQAATGVSGLKATLDAINEHRASLFKPSGSIPTINKLLKQHKDLTSVARLRMLSVTSYTKLNTELNQAKSQVKELSARQSNLAVVLRRIERIQRNLPRFARRSELESKRLALGDVVNLPKEASEVLTRAKASLDAAAANLKREQARVTDLDTQLSGYGNDDVIILALKSRIVALGEKRPVYEELAAALPRRQSDLDTLHRSARDLLASAELSGDPSELGAVVPSELKRSAIAALHEEGTRLSTQAAGAARAQETAGRKLTAANSAASHVSSARDVSSLRQVYEEASGLGKVDEVLSDRSAKLAAAAATLTQAVRSLGFPEIDGLRSMRYPSATTINRFVNSYKQAEAGLEQANQLVDQIESQIKAKLSELMSMEQTPGFTAESDLMEARRRRERGWELVRAIHIDGKMDLGEAASQYAEGGVLADAYARNVAGADQLADTLRHDASRVAAHGVLARQIAQLRKRLEEAQAALSPAKAGVKAVDADWRRQWSGLDPILPPAEMTDYVARRERILQEADRLLDEKTEIETLTGRRDTIAARLRQALTEAAINPPAAAQFEPLRLAARLALEAQQKHLNENELLSQALKTALAAFKEAQEEATKAQNDLSSWQQRWEVVLAQAGLPNTLSREQAIAVNAVFAKLLSEKKAIDSMTERIATIERDKSGFAKAVAAVAGELGLMPGIDPGSQCLALEQRLQAAELVFAEKSRLKSDLVRHQALRDDAQAAFGESEGVIGRLSLQARCEPKVLEEAIMRSHAAQALDIEIGRIEEDLVQDGGGLDLATLEQECAGATGDSVAAELERLTAEAAQLQPKLQEAMTKEASLQAELDRAASGALALDARQDLAITEAELGQQVERYAELTIEEAMLRRAIESYRQANEGPIIGRAKLLFKELTNSAYAGLRVEEESSGQNIILAERADGRSLEIDELSDGTQDSLYLALRFAVIEQHNAAGEPIPFVADDLLLNLDDSRATAAFRVLARIAEASQVLFFTHHDHMVALAQAAVATDRLTIHRIGSASRSAEIVTAK